MSLSIDDLVNSFSSSHIGQEAIDLAALQAQLAQTLFAQSSSSQAPHRGYVQPANTPTRTPSSSMCWDPRELARSRSASVSSIGAQLHSEHRLESEDMDEDERMVEDMLLSSPTSTSSSTHAAFAHRHARSGSASSRMHIVPGSSAYDHPQYDLPSPNAALFATTDPFLTAQLQAAQNPSTSVFAQAGRPSPHSPFLAHQYQSMYAHNPVSPEAEAHTRFATGTAAF